VPRRKADAVLPIEERILETGLALAGSGEDAFHGYSLAKEMRGREGARLLTGHGTLYRALKRMEKRGWLQGWWEAPATGEREGRPPRKLYRVTATGQRALAKARADRRATPATGTKALGAMP